MHIPSLTNFLGELSQNNNRPWFLHNKPNYDILREEFTALTAEVIQGVAKFDKNIEHADPKKSLFRIYRDVRFSKNKDPYKTHFSAFIGNRSRADPVPGYYFQITEKGMLGVGGGHYSPRPDILKRYRDFIVSHPDKLAKLLKNKRLIATYGGLSDEERMSRPPKGYAANLALIEQIKNRHFFGFVEIDLKNSKAKDLAEDIVVRLEAVHPLIVWLREALK